MGEKRIKLDRTGYSDKEAAHYLFPNVLRKQFLTGLFVGAVFMAALNIGDVHICVGECDDEGLKLIAGREE